ncbi:MAG: indolepyruvate oxidoreductase subunit beta [Candidatus Omnitrophica bacterium]|nr:indolepyruvate oxidoreductase subunit beta [Candidatus Omnitrophota bacterium]
MVDKTTNILFCGTGGQGVLKAAEVACWAAIFAGFHAKKSEVHGMAQRGGSVESHVRFGRKVFSPLITKGACDILVPFYPDEEARLRSFLKPGGIDLLPCLDKFRQKSVPPIFLNTFLLGALAGQLTLSKEAWMKAIGQEFHNKRLEDNIRFFLAGWEEEAAA